MTQSDFTNNSTSSDNNYSPNDQNPVPLINNEQTVQIYSKLDDSQSDLLKSSSTSSEIIFNDNNSPAVNNTDTKGGTEEEVQVVLQKQPAKCTFSQV